MPIIKYLDFTQPSKTVKSASNKYDFLIDSDNKVYVAIKDSDDWRPVEDPEVKMDLLLNYGNELYLTTSPSNPYLTLADTLRSSGHQEKIIQRKKSEEKERKRLLFKYSIYNLELKIWDELHKKGIFRSAQDKFDYRDRMRYPSLFNKKGGILKGQNGLSTSVIDYNKLNDNINNLTIGYDNIGLSKFNERMRNLQELNIPNLSKSKLINNLIEASIKAGKAAISFAKKNSDKGEGKKSSSKKASNDNKNFEDVIANIDEDTRIKYDLDISSPKALQQSLNRAFDAGLEEDGIWGPKSLAALEAALATNGPTNADYHPAMTGYVDANGIYHEGEIPLQQQVVESLGIDRTTSPFYGIPYPGSVDMNRADIRAILSHYGYNPYLDLTGSLRKALRKWLAGDKSLNISWIDKNSDMYKDWIAPYTYYEKKGGRLIPRNPVERFLKGKNLPTAPRAEDRYKNSVKGTRNYAWKKAESVKLEVEKHGTMDSSKPAEILRYVDSPGDTVYIEYPDIHPGPFRIMRQVPRTASTKRPLGDEYNILKRRFNTAWNLAKQRMD